MIQSYKKQQHCLCNTKRQIIEGKLVIQFLNQNYFFQNDFSLLEVRAFVSVKELSDNFIYIPKRKPFFMTAKSVSRSQFMIWSLELWIFTTATCLQRIQFVNPKYTFCKILIIYTEAKLRFADESEQTPRSGFRKDFEKKILKRKNF